MLAGERPDEDAGEQQQDSDAEHDVERSVGACDRLGGGEHDRPCYQLARRRARLAAARCALRRLRSSRRRGVSVVWTRQVVVTQRPCWAASGSASASPITR